MSYPVEALLRPPIEAWSALVAASAAGIAALAPWALMMPPAIGYATATGLAGLAVYRARGAFRVYRYQRNLVSQPRYVLSPRHIKSSPTRLFLGRGFRWEQQHTQRLRDTLRPQHRRYLQPPRLQRLARAVETRAESSPPLRPLAALLSMDTPLNPLRPPPAVGGNPALHGVEPDERDIFMPLADRAGHTVVLGTTRVGKTRLAETLITQDIHRGDTVIVLDPKGDADLMRRCYAEACRAGRQDEFAIFHLGFPELSARYNAIGSFSKVSEVASRLAGQLPAEGNSAAFREFAWRFTNIVARALVELGRTPSYEQIANYIMNIEPLLIEYYQQWLARVAPAGWEERVRDLIANPQGMRVLPSLRNRSPEAVALLVYARSEHLSDPVADGLRSAMEYDRTYFDKIVASLLPLLEKLTSGPTGALLSPDYLNSADPRPILDWRDVIRGGGIVYVGLDALSDFAVAAAVGNSMFADLVSVAGEIYKRGHHTGLPPGAEPPPPRATCIHADEFNELIGDEFIPLLNKAGGAGFQVTAYTQTVSDIEARVGTAAKSRQVLGNLNTIIMLRVRERATAELLTDQLPRVQIHQITEVSGVSDSADPTGTVDFTSRNEDRLTVTTEPMLDPGDVMALPKGQAFVLLSGAQLYKLRLPLPSTEADPHLPSSIAELHQLMQARYTTADRWWSGDTPPAP